MKIIRRLFTGATLLATFVLCANADQVVYTSTLSPTNVDITNTSLAVTPFQAGAGGVPLDAVLNYFTITFNETIAGSLTVINGGVSAQTVTATLDSDGLLYLFNPTPSGDLVDGKIPQAAPPCDDAFGGPPSTTAGPNTNGCSGSDPDPSFKKSVINLAAGSSAGPFTYSKSGSAITSSISDPTSLAAVQSAWNVYLDTASNLTITSGASGNATYSDQVSGTVAVTYNYTEVTGTPEPATMVLFGSALVGLGLLRKRVRNS
jgi:hypothetical protein